MSLLETRRRRLIAGGIALALVAALTVVAGSLLFRNDSDSWVSAVISGSGETELKVDDNLAVVVPEGAAPAGATLRGRRIAPTYEQVSYLGPLAAVDLELSSGEPAVPLRLRLNLREPLPLQHEPVLVHVKDDGVPEVWPAQLSEDRLTVLADIPHLSGWETFWRDVTDPDIWSAVIGEIFGTRTEPPTCQGNTPRWARNVDFLDGDINAPLLVCVGSDPADPDVLVVKIANNRGLGVTVTTPVPWEWVWLGGTDSGIMPTVVNTMAWAMQRVNMPNPDRSLILAPRQEVHFGFRQSAFASSPATAAIVAKPDLIATVFGLLWTAMESTVGDPGSLGPLELGVLARCLTDGAFGAADQVPDWTHAGTVGREVLTCAAANAEHIIGVLIETLPANAWEAIRDRMPQYDAVKFLRNRVGRPLIVFDAFWKAAEGIATVVLWHTAPAAFRVSIHVSGSTPPSGGGGSAAVLTGHSGDVEALAWSPDGRRLASGGGDGTVRVWNTETGKQIRAFDAHAVGEPFGGVTALAWSPDGALLASGGDDGVRLWHADTGQPVAGLLASFPVDDVAWSPDGSLFVAVGNNTTTPIWQANGARVRSVGTGGLGVAWSPAGDQLVIGGVSSAQIWNAVSGALVRTLPGDSGVVWDVAWSPDGTLIAAATGISAATQQVRLWRAGSGELVRTLPGPASRVAFSPDGTQLAVLGDGAPRIWSTGTGELIRTLPGHTGHVLSIVWSPDGLRLATGSDDGTVRIWS